MSHDEHVLAIATIGAVVVVGGIHRLIFEVVDETTPPSQRFCFRLENSSNPSPFTRLFELFLNEGMLDPFDAFWSMAWIGRSKSYCGC